MGPHGYHRVLLLSSYSYHEKEEWLAPMTATVVQASKHYHRFLLSDPPTARPVCSYHRRKGRLP